MAINGLESLHRREAVTDTSAAVYRAEAEHVHFRERTVLGWLESAGVIVDPTSAELAILFRESAPIRHLDVTGRLLFVRRGLSGLKALGKVEHGEARMCAVSRKRCETWRATSGL